MAGGEGGSEGGRGPHPRGTREVPTVMATLSVTFFDMTASPLKITSQYLQKDPSQYTQHKEHGALAPELSGELVEHIQFCNLRFQGGSQYHQRCTGTIWMGSCCPS